MPAIDELSYQDYLRIFRRRWKLGAIGGAIGLVGGVAFARFQAPPAIYDAISVVSHSPYRGFEVTETTLPPRVSREPADQIPVIRGASVLASAARKLGMIPADAPPDAVARYQPKIDELISRVWVSTDPKRSEMLWIHGTGATGDEAVKLANAVSVAYREENLRDLKQFVVRRREFLEREIHENEERLNHAQLEYEQYRRAHPLAVAEAGAQAVSDAAKAKDLADRIEETHRQLELVNSGRPVSDLGLISIVGAKSTTRLTQLSMQYTNLQLQKAQMLVDLTEEHPLVKAKDAEIARVRRGLADELELIQDAFEKQQDELKKQAEATRALEQSIPAEAQQLAHLEHQVKMFDNIGTQLGTQLVDAMLKDTGVIGQVQIVSPARASLGPLNPPQYLRFGGVGGAAGLFMGVVVGVLLETSRFTARRLRELEASLEIPVLGTNVQVTSDALAQCLAPRPAPSAGSVEWSRALALMNLIAPRSSMSEAIRALRASLQGFVDDGHSALTICGTAPGEGATTTATNLAFSFAQAGKRVVLVEADLRNPTISILLGLEREPGFTDLLEQTVSLDRAIRNVADFVTGALSVDDLLGAPGIDRLHVIPCGRKTSRAVELLGSPAFSAALDVLRSRYDVILFDGPPLSVASDSLMLGKQSAAIVVFSPTRTEPAQLENAVLQLRKSGCSIVGMFVSAMEIETRESAALAATL